MNRLLRYALVGTLLMSLLLFLSLISEKTDQERLSIACSSLDVVVTDSSTLSFVNHEDVKKFIAQDYGVYLGQRIDSVNLRKIEDSLRTHSAIKDAEAYTTRDGVLHVMVSQREPVVKFKNGKNIFYADASGFLIPSGKEAFSGVTEIEGKIPISEDASYRGRPDTEDEQQWLDGIISLVEYIRGKEFWKDGLSKIQSAEDGTLTLYPKEGKEKFLFGSPEDIPQKFERMERYYCYIVPAREKDYYKSVDVRFAGQIVCREK